MRTHDGGFFNTLSQTKSEDTSPKLAGLGKRYHTRLRDLQLHDMALKPVI